MVLAFSDTSTVQVSVSVSQDDVAALFVGQSSTVTISDAGTFEGIVTEINEKPGKPEESSNENQQKLMKQNKWEEWMMKKKQKRIDKIILLLLLLAADIAAACYTVWIKPRQNQEVVVYKEETVQRGDLTVGVTESGSLSFGITSQLYDSDCAVAVKHLLFYCVRM